MDKEIRIIKNNVFNKVKYAYQRLTRGWDDRAYYDIDYYLANLIPQLVRKLKEKEIGFPAEMIEGEVPYEIAEKAQKEYTEKWHNILDSIAEGFEEYGCAHNCIMHPDYEMTKFENGFKLFKEYFNCLWR